MLRRKIIVIGGILAGLISLAFRETLAAAIGAIAKRILNPDLFAGGRFMTFTVADILILTFLATALIVLCWPWISRHLQTEVERNTLVTQANQRPVFVDLTFHDEKNAIFLSQHFKPVFVDCTFKTRRIAIIDCLFSDGFRLEPKNVTFCSHDELHKLGSVMPSLDRATLINSPIYSDHVFLTEWQAKELFQNAPVKGLIPLDASLLSEKHSMLSLARFRRPKGKVDENDNNKNTNPPAV